MDPACLAWQLPPVSPWFFWLLPKTEHPVKFPVMCELYNKKPKIILVNHCTSSFLSCLYRTVALFLLEPAFTYNESWCTVYHLQRKCCDCLEIRKLLSASPIVKAFSVLLEKNTQLKAMYNWITFLIVISAWLQLWWLWPFQLLDLLFTVCRIWWSW